MLSEFTSLNFSIVLSINAFASATPSLPLLDSYSFANKYVVISNLLVIAGLVPSFNVGAIIFSTASSLSVSLPVKVLNAEYFVAVGSKELFRIVLLSKLPKALSITDNGLVLTISKDGVDLEPLSADLTEAAALPLNIPTLFFNVPYLAIIGLML